MFVRRTQTRSTASGDRYFTFRLVHSERVGARVRQRTLLNLGRHFAIPQAHWPLLCVRLEQLLSRQQTLIPATVTPTVEPEAQRIAAQLLARQVALGAVPAKPTGGAAECVFDRVDVASLELLRPRSVGVEQVALWAMEQVRLIPLLQSLGLNGRQRAAAVGSIIGRMAAPGSERATYRWLCQRSALGELLQVDFETMSMMQLYRAADALVRHQQQIEEHLFNRVTELFGLPTTVTLYDLTNTYFEGVAAAQPLASHGHSKEKRSDCPLLTLALVLDGSGFVRRSEVMAGKISEGEVLRGVLERLEVPKGALIVMDCGAATEQNLSWLREQGYRYLVVSLERTRHFDAAAAVSLTTAGEQQVQVQKVPSDDGAEVRLYCHSEARKGKEQALLKKACARFEKSLQELHDGLSRPRTHKKVEAVWRRIGREKQQQRGRTALPDQGRHGHQRPAGHRRHLASGSGGGLEADPSGSVLPAQQPDRLGRRGDVAHLHHAHRSGSSVSFPQVGTLRPIYHQKQERSNGHLFITVLAYQLVQGSAGACVSSRNIGHGAACAKSAARHRELSSC